MINRPFQIQNYSRRGGVKARDPYLFEEQIVTLQRRTDQLRNRCNVEEIDIEASRIDQDASYIADRTINLERHFGAILP